MHANEPITHLRFQQVKLAALDMRDVHPPHVTNVDEAYVCVFDQWVLKMQAIERRSRT